MKARHLIVPLVLGLFGFLALEYLQFRLGLGRFAQSPQRLELVPGGRAIAGGGRASLSWVSGEAKGILVSVACKDTRRQVELRPERVVEGNCGVVLRLLEIHGRPGPVRGALVEVSWDS